MLQLRNSYNVARSWKMAVGGKYLGNLKETFLLFGAFSSVEWEGHNRPKPGYLFIWPRSEDDTSRTKEHSVPVIPACHIKVSHGLIACLTSAILVNIQSAQKSLYCRDNMSDIESKVLDELRDVHSVDNEGSGTMYSIRWLPRFLKHLMLSSSWWILFRM
jgi:hypothetical protein